MQSDPLPFGPNTPPPPPSAPPSRRAWLTPALILGAILVLGVTLLAYALLRDTESADGGSTDGGPALLHLPVSFHPVHSTADPPCRTGRPKDPTGSRCLVLEPGMTVRKVESIRIKAGDGVFTNHGVTLSLTPEDARKLADLTAAADERGRVSTPMLAITVDGEAVAAPPIDGSVTGGKINITGPGFTKAYTENLFRRITVR